MNPTRNSTFVPRLPLPLCSFLKIFWHLKSSPCLFPPPGTSATFPLGTPALSTTFLIIPNVSPWAEAPPPFRPCAVTGVGSVLRLQFKKKAELPPGCRERKGGLSLPVPFPGSKVRKSSEGGKERRITLTPFFAKREKVRRVRPSLNYPSPGRSISPPFHPSFSM